MDWKKERDTLIAQTLVFVQSVSRKKDHAGEAVRISDAALEAEAVALDAVKITEPYEMVESPKNVLNLPAKASSDVRTEIQDRVANFRAHQERFHREREQYFSTTMAKARAAVRDDSTPLR